MRSAKQTQNKQRTTSSLYFLKGQCHGDLVLFQESKNVFGLTETVK